jgi:hypothetical protein
VAGGEVAAERFDDGDDPVISGACGWVDEVQETKANSRAWSARMGMSRSDAEGQLERLWAPCASGSDGVIVGLQDWTSEGREEMRQDVGERKGPKMGGAVTSRCRN